MEVTVIQLLSQVNLLISDILPCASIESLPSLSQTLFPLLSVGSTGTQAISATINQFFSHYECNRNEMLYIW